MVKKGNMANDIIADDNQCFWLCNGGVLKSKGELLEALRGMDEGVFSYHVNEEKNDFGNWIHGVFGDEALANKIFKAREKDKIIGVLEKEMKKKAEGAGKIGASKPRKKNVLATLKGAFQNESS